jgi:hypothetical protein
MKPFRNRARFEIEINGKTWRIVMDRNRKVAVIHQKYKKSARLLSFTDIVELSAGQMKLL